MKTLNLYRLHNEIERLNEYLMPTPTEKQFRNNVLTRIKSVMLNIWPHAHFELFGSYSNGLQLPNSDFDLTVLAVSDPSPRQTLKKALLAKSITESNTILFVDRTDLQIIKFTDRESGIKFDVLFNKDHGWQTRDLINKYIQKYPILSKLVRTLKLFLRQHNLKSTFKGMIS